MSAQNGNGKLPSARVHPITRIYAMASRASREHAERYGTSPARKPIDPADRPTKEQAWQAYCANAQEFGEPMDREAFECWWRVEE